MIGLPSTVERFLLASSAAFTPMPSTVASRRAALRERSDDLFEAFSEPCPAAVTAEDHHIEGPDGTLRLRIYRPAEDATLLAPHLVLHGGGWWLGTIDEAIVDHTCRWRAHDSGTAVIALEYRLAPEHPFPAGLEDAWTALTWLDAHAAELRLDRRRLSVGGASAGANIAAALCLLTARRGGPHITYAALEVPVVDLSRWAVLRPAAVGSDPALDGDDLREALSCYLTDPATQVLDPLVSPLLADDLAVMPPTQIITAEHDPLRTEGLEMVAALRAAGVAVAHVDVAGGVHAAPYLTADWAPARTWRRAVDVALREACNPAARYPDAYTTETGLEATDVA